MSNSYALDRSSRLYSHVSLERDSLRMNEFMEGGGMNILGHSIWSCHQSLSGGGSSTDGLILSSSAESISGMLSISQRTMAMGGSESFTEAKGPERAAYQSAGVVNGTATSLQHASFKDGEATAAQDSILGGFMGYSRADSSSDECAAKVTGGLNGCGLLKSHIATSASNGADASGIIAAESLDSRAYAAGRAVREGCDVYSYLSSLDRLESDVRARSCQEPHAEQIFSAGGGVDLFSSSSGQSRSYSAEALEASGMTRTGPAGTELEVEGDLQSTASNLVPTPGSWIWEEKGGYISSNPFIIEDRQGRDHVLALGGNMALYDNIDGNWFALGGYLTSNPYALRDSQGRIHILARGGDGALYDNIFDTSAWSTTWSCLGGYLTSDAIAVADPGSPSHIKIAVRGGDNALWMKDLNTTDMSSPGWMSRGGIITSNPHPIFDYSGKLHTFALGADGSLYDNVATPTSQGYSAYWIGLGGRLTSDPMPIQDPRYPSTLHIFGRGGDGDLWDYRFNTYRWEADWLALGGYTAPAGSRSPFYMGNPVPVADAYRNIHTLVVGGDGMVWENVMDTKSLKYDWNSLGVEVTSDATAMLDRDNAARLALRARDGGLLVAPYTR